MSQKLLIREFSVQPVVIDQSTWVDEREVHLLEERGDKQWLLEDTLPISGLKSGCFAVGVQAGVPDHPSQPGEKVAEDTTAMLLLHPQ